MQFDFLEKDELDKITEDEWDYILSYVCEDCSGSHNDWGKEEFDKLQLYGTGADLRDFVKDDVTMDDLIEDFYKETIGDELWEAEGDDPYCPEAMRGMKLIDEFVDHILFWFFAPMADAMQAHKDWLANTPDVQEWKKNVLEFRKEIAERAAEDDA